MVNLTTHSTHFIFQLYGIGHVVNDHSDNKRGNLQLQLKFTLFESQQGIFYMHHPTDITA